MELLYSTKEDYQRIEIYNEYLRKITELLKQLETVEKMYEKALLEEKMLNEKDEENRSVELYRERLNRIKMQCEERSKDIRQQCHLIFGLKAQLEEQCDVLKKMI